MRLLAACAFVLITPAAALGANTLAVDLKASHATFAVQHVLVERVTGSVPIVAVDLHTAGDGVTPTSIEAVLDPRRIDTGDGDRDGDLQGADWFDTKTFAQWTFKSTRIAPASGGAVSVEGTLTIHGVEVPTTLAVRVVRVAPHPAYHATTTVDRHAFHMTVTRVDALVGNDVSVTLDIETK